MIAKALGVDLTVRGAAATTVAGDHRAASRGAPGCRSRRRWTPACGCELRAEEDAVAVFATNLKDLLLAAPAGNRTTLGLDPGFRTGVKVAVVDGTGKVVDTCAIFPHQPQKQWDAAKATLAALVARHGVELIAVGNGTASRETDALAAELIADIRSAGATAPAKAMVSEAGASVYSASAYAAHELPDLDVTLRGAVSIARRLQDPLAELVKIEPKSIGVGQYQHDVDAGHPGPQPGRRGRGRGERRRGRPEHGLGAAAGPRLRVSPNRWPRPSSPIATGRPVPEPSCACSRFRAWAPRHSSNAPGFLRIRDGEDPLDASGVHPEAYPVVRRILDRSGRRPSPRSSATSARCARLRPADFADDRFGIPTVTDILGRTREARARSAPGVHDRDVRRRGREGGRPQGRAWSWKVWSPTSRRSGRSSTSASTRTGSCTSRRWLIASSPIRTRWCGPARWSR